MFDGNSQLNSFAAPFTGTDANAVVEGQDKDLPVTDFAFFTGPTTLNDGVDRRFDKIVIHGNLELHLA